MQIFYASLQDIQQQTMQLDVERCMHCCQTRQLVSHGFVRKKRVGGVPEAVGKRVFCSNRNQRTGCGRTLQLYLDATLRYLHYAGACVVALLLGLARGMSVQSAYQQATGTLTPRNAYRWRHALSARLSCYRSLVHQPVFDDTPRPCWQDTPNAGAAPPRWALLVATCQALRQQIGDPLCANYQRQLQRSFW